MADDVGLQQQVAVRAAAPQRLIEVRPRRSVVLGDVLAQHAEPECPQPDSVGSFAVTLKPASATAASPSWASTPNSRRV
jgi:hypothetical protein